ncbi:HrpW-specific chaperone [Pseudomonas sp. 21LCFQ02]|uniref:HrpW-specific chaperone n=1 Tax=unclassified Pseudomonas TaxID=196821 RepID=UPI0020985A62|nr:MULTISPECIES: HrpW-specific chaperone [unclassified Pseudomonas]MCO8161127.1 HrpW-specific chaperone [Pseudomonas sp. 21LCFQ010]MCO8169098.1 HrpW-specific chaperone [Pseudomonas sp. 21LCFQ02]MCQ9422103.1 HrpW-specific chaperone [Pseudomonas sp. LJDD11]
MTPAQPRELSTPNSWAALVRGGGYVTAHQRQALENAIGLVSQRLQAALDRPGQRASERFDLDHYIDSLEPDFKRSAGTDPLRGDASLTAFWIVRLLTDRLLEASAKRQG